MCRVRNQSACFCRDAILPGTGIRQLGKDLLRAEHIETEKPVYIGFSHFHWDHIQGLPFFLPAYDAKRHFIISAIGKERFGKDIKSIFQTQMQEDYFPVPLHGMGAEISFHQSPDESFTVGKAEVGTLKHNHPGDAYSYRIEDVEGNVVVFCTDIEHGESLDQQIVELAKGADLLIHEGQYTPEELAAHTGWGHSSWEQAVEVAVEAGVHKLVITHHDPDHDDAFLRQIEKAAQERFAGAVLVRVGMEIIL